MNQYRITRLTEDEDKPKRIGIFHKQRRDIIAVIYCDQLISFNNKHEFSLQELQMVTDIANNFQLIYDSLSD